MKIRAQLIRTCANSKDSLKRNSYSQEHPYQKTREISNIQSLDVPQTLRKTRASQSQKCK
jgi:hypothetical protein